MPTGTLAAMNKSSLAILHTDLTNGLKAGLFVGILAAIIPTGEADAASTAEIQLLPAGEFRARDGRPTECDHWFLDGKLAAAIIALADARETAFAIDYDHQTIRSATNGLPAPAAGWFKKLEWRDGKGLFAVDVTWSARAQRYIDDGEYKFISPVFLYDAQGNVTEMVMAAITNTPALDGMDDVLAAAASFFSLPPLPSLPPQQETGRSDFSASLTTAQPEKQESVMDELLERLRWMLNLPVSSTAADIIRELNKLIAMIGGEQATAAASFDILAVLTAAQDKDKQLIATLNTSMAALAVNQADPAKFVPMAVFNEAQAKLAALSAQTVQSAQTELDRLVESGKKEGRIVGQEHEAHLRSLPLAVLQAMLPTMPQIAALTSTQVQPGLSHSAAPADHLDTAHAAVCAMFGNKPEDVQKHMPTA